MKSPLRGIHVRAHLTSKDELKELEEEIFHARIDHATKDGNDELFKILIILQRMGALIHLVDALPFADRKKDAT